MLLDHGADFDIQSEWYRNALWAAQFEGRGHVVQMLLDHRVDPDHPDYLVTPMNGSSTR